MSGVTLMDNKSTRVIMQMFDMIETTDQLLKASSVRWYVHILRKRLRYLPRCA